MDQSSEGIILEVVGSSFGLSAGHLKKVENVHDDVAIFTVLLSFVFVKAVVVIFVGLFIGNLNVKKQC